MKTWLAAILCACSLTAAAQTTGKDLYFTVAAVAAGREVQPDGPEVKQTIKYLRGIAVAYNVTEENAAQTASAGLNILRPKVNQANLFEMLDAAYRIAPTEHTHDRNALVHALTTYIAARSGADPAHEAAIKTVMEINKAAK